MSNHVLGATWGPSTLMSSAGRPGLRFVSNMYMHRNRSRRWEEPGRAWKSLSFWKMEACPLRQRTGLCNHSFARVVEARCTAADSNSPIESLREELSSLERELVEVQDKASSANSRSNRLKKALENLDESALKALKAAKEDGAKKILGEKLGVMRALERSQQRAEALERLAIKLKEAISFKESQLIVALSTKRGRLKPAQDPRSQPSSTTRATASPDPLEVVSPSEEELNRRFLDLERQNLENMLRRSMGGGGGGTGSDDNDVGREERGRSASSSGRTDGGEGGESPGLQGKKQTLEGSGGWAGLSGNGGRQQGAVVEGEAGADRDRLLRQVDDELEGLQGKLVELVRERERAVGGRPGAEGRGSGRGDGADAIERKIGSVRKLQRELQAVREKILAPNGGDLAMGSGEPSLEEGGREREREAEVFRAKHYLRERDELGAAACLHSWLEDEMLVLHPLPEQHSSWNEIVTRHHDPQLQITAAEAQALYGAYLQHWVIPMCRSQTLKTAGTLPMLIQSRPAEGVTGGDGSEQLQVLQAFLGLTEGGAVKSLHKRVLLSSLVDVALTAREEEEVSAFAVSLEQTLGVPKREAVEAKNVASSAIKFRSLVAVVLRELEPSWQFAALEGGTSVVWADRLWEEVRRGRASLDLPPAAALAAAAAACRDECARVLGEVADPPQKQQQQLLSAARAQVDPRGALVAKKLLAFVQSVALPLLAFSSAAPQPQEDPNLREASEASDSGPVSSGTAAPAPASLPNLLPLLRLQAVPLRDAEALFSSLCLPHFSESLTRATAGDGGEEETSLEGVASREAGQAGAVEASAEEEGAQLPDVPGAEVLAAVLGLSATSCAELAARMALSVYGTEVRRAMGDGSTGVDWRELAAKRAALGLSVGVGKREEEQAAAEVAGAVASRLLKKRIRGNDISSADVRQLANVCRNVGAKQVQGVDARDRVALLRRGVQAALESGISAASASVAASDALRLLSSLRASLALPTTDADQVQAAVAEAAAASCLVEARAAVKRGDVDLCARDMGRMAVALVLLPAPPQDATGRGMMKVEAIRLFQVYTGSQGTSTAQPSLDWETRLLKEDMDKRVQLYLGILSS